MSMRAPALLLAAVLLAALAPASAFELESLEVTVSPSGSAEVAMAWDPTLVERLVVGTAVAVPGRALERALGALTGRRVRVGSATTEGAVFTVPDFARVTRGRDGTVYATPRVDFARFGRALDSYWFAPFVAPDLTPGRLALTLPDGATFRFDGAGALPAVTHRA